MLRQYLVQAQEHIVARTVGQIFSDAYAFEVPCYQRPYVWEEDDVRQLLSDLLDAMDHRRTSGGMYFLGSIFLIKSWSDPQSKIINGQNRLTTLTIMLSVLRDLTTEKEKRFDRRQYIFQKANAHRGTSERFRVLLRNRDRRFFLKHVQQPGGTNTLPDLGILAGSQYRIAANVHYLRENLEALNESRRDELVAFIVQHCYLVVVAVPTAKALVVQVMISLFRWSMSFLRGLKGEVSGKSCFPLQSKRSHRRNSRPQHPAPAGLCSNMPCVNSRTKPASARK
jgi:Protein of unknown function DUF262